MEMIPGPQALILLVKFPSRCSSTCVIVRGMKPGMNLLLFLIRLHNSAERQVRAMSYFIYAEWKTSWSKANVGSGSGWGQIGPGAASLPQETGVQAPWQVEVLRLELLFCCSFVPHPRQHFYEYLQMRGTHLSDNPCFPWVWISDVEHLHILPLHLRLEMLRDVSRSIREYFNPKMVGHAQNEESLITYCGFVTCLRPVEVTPAMAVARRF